MQEIAKALEEIGFTSGSIEKTKLLRKYENVVGFKEVLQFIYNPYIRTGIAGAKLNKGRYDGQPEVYVTWREVISYFASNSTGSAADVRFAWDFINTCKVYFKGSSDVAMQMVAKNLKIGVTAKTLNKVYGNNFVPYLDLMLGKSYQDYKYSVKGPFILTEKLDGHRRLLIKENGKVTAYTRSGIKDTGMVGIEIEASLLPDNMVYDGEALAKGKFKNALELRQATNSIMNSNGLKVGITFNIFDMIPLHEFRVGVSSLPAYTRKLILASLFNDSTKQLIKPSNISQLHTYDIRPIEGFYEIRSVPILGIASSEKDIIEYAKPIWDIGFEGVMALQWDSKYELKRSDNLLKVKATETLELPIIDFVEGTGKYTGMLGSFIVDYKGFPVGVGSGLTNDERDKFWQDRDNLVGVKIELNTFGETTNKDGTLSLNCGIFKGLRFDK